MVIVVDWGGRVEELKLASRSTGALRDVLLTHHGSQALIEENKWWKGMILLPWANRIAFVSNKKWKMYYRIFDGNMASLSIHRESMYFSTNPISCR